MPSYKTHCAINTVIAWIAGYIAYIYNFRIETISILLFGIYFGTAWLAPDLDTNSKNTNIHGRIWKVMWIPYTWIMPHRGKSHDILIGFSGRVLYLSAVIILSAWMIHFLIHIDIIPILDTVVNTESGRFILSWLLIGILIANTGHVLADSVGSGLKRMIKV
jgi:uncharacterized metal-binding protein